MGHVWVKADDIDRLLRADRFHEIEIQENAVRVTLGTVSYAVFSATGGRQPSPRSIEDLVFAIADAESRKTPCLITARPADGEEPSADASAEVDVVWEKTDLYERHRQRVYAEDPAEPSTPSFSFPPPYRPAEDQADLS